MVTTFRGRDAFFSDEPPPIDGSLVITITPEMIERLRRMVKDKGSDVVFVRMSDDEKLALSDIVHDYRHRGIKTSENELGRIALALAIRDYLMNKEQSVLAQVLAALRA